MYESALLCHVFCIVLTRTEDIQATQEAVGAKVGTEAKSFEFPSCPCLQASC